MTTLKKILLAIPALLYITVVKLRHSLFDWGVLRSQRFATPIICVGNITVGGSGKTPITELLIEELSPTHNIALLSRGYGRTTHGYLEVDVESNYLEVGDEPLQIKRKYPHCRVVVCERRAVAIPIIEALEPKIDIIIMDDGFQHRHVNPSCNIVVIDSTRPVFNDHPMPLGSLRDSLSSLRRANLFMVTKCQRDISNEQMEQMSGQLSRYGNQPVIFTCIANGTPISVFGSSELTNSAKLRALVLSGIGNPAPFIETLSKRYNIASIMSFADHHIYNSRDLAKIEMLIAQDQDIVVITTEKDSVKFLTIDNLSELIRSRLYYLPMSMEFISHSPDEFIDYIH